MKSCLLSELLLISLEKTVQIFEMVAEGSGARDASRAGSTLLYSPVRHSCTMASITSRVPLLLSAGG